MDHGGERVGEEFLGMRCRVMRSRSGRISGTRRSRKGWPRVLVMDSKVEGGEYVWRCGSARGQGQVVKRGLVVGNDRFRCL